jgi:hypothetical protein
MSSFNIRKVVALSTLATFATLAAAATLTVPAAADEAAPYPLPWQLRPAAAGTAIRLDSVFAGYDNTTGVVSGNGFTVAPTLVASYKIPGTGDGWTGLAPLVKLAAVGDSSFAIVNPVVGATYALSLPAGVRTAFFLGATIPIGMGNGDSPDKGVTSARGAGQYARSQMDDSLFAVDDFALIPGIDVAWVGGGFTVQAEATLFQLWRVNGSTVNPATKKASDPDATKTNFTTGLHVGYFVIPLLSVGVDLRYQRWLSNPVLVQKDTTGTLVDNLTVAIGPRLHIPLVEGIKIHPGLAYAQGLDKPMNSPLGYHIVQLDIPVTF